MRGSRPPRITETPLSETPAHTAHVLRPVALADPLGAFEHLRGGAYPWLLDSALRGGPRGRFSFAGADPYALVRARGAHLEVETLREVHAGLPSGPVAGEAPLLEGLRGLLPRPPRGQLPEIPFIGGAVGYLGYEFAEQLDVHRLCARDDWGLPDLSLLLVDALLAFDHEAGTSWISGLGFGHDAADAQRRAQQAADALEARLETPVPPRATTAPATLPDEDASPAQHHKAIDAILEEIAAGNVYQACLTHRWARNFQGDPWQLHLALRRINPAPFAAFLELPEVVISSSSPERFLRLSKEGRVESRPIKGTAARGLHPAEDEARRLALEQSAKDRAEHLMIVDLVRNDLGRVCETGSVAVPELMHIEPYAQVFQMVSGVVGQLHADRDVLDLVAACFPPGSMTGAPKIAAMRLLDHLEPVRRGVYSGALGYFDARGGADLSVVIRALLVREGRAHLHAGGGIVADSRPDAELREAHDKLRPLLQALAEIRAATDYDGPPPS
ncbi:MAG: aminodeoxychorismate synthase component I [Myxococcota bacterium]